MSKVSCSDFSFRKRMEAFLYSIDYHEEIFMDQVYEGIPEVIPSLRKNDYQALADKVISKVPEYFGELSSDVLKLINRNDLIKVIGSDIEQEIGQFIESEGFPGCIAEEFVEYGIIAYVNNSLKDLICDDIIEEQAIERSLEDNQSAYTTNPADLEFERNHPDDISDDEDASSRNKKSHHKNKSEPIIDVMKLLDE